MKISMAFLSILILFATSNFGQEAGNWADLTASPNPAMGSVELKVTVSAPGAYLFSAVDPHGRTIGRRLLMLEAGQHRMNAELLQKGIHVFVLSPPPDAASVKVINLEPAQQNHITDPKLVHHFTRSAMDTGAGADVPDGSPCPDLPAISWPGKTYPTVKIGSQCWMARNLDAGVMIPGYDDQLDNGALEKYCYNNDEVQCDHNGALYQWDEIMDYDIYASGTQGICPDGFHIPTDEEWKVQEGAFDSEYGVGDPQWDLVGQRGYDVALNMKTSGWGYPDNGSGMYSFSVLSAGIFHYAGWFQQYRFNGRFWTSDKGPAHGAWYRSFNAGYNTVYRNNYGDRDSGFSLICVRND